jgi:hypothetical protein
LVASGISIGARVPTFAIDAVDADGKRKESLAGANNIYAANRAFDELLLHLKPGEILQLRQRGRVLRREAAVGGHRERIIAQAQELKK